MRASHRGSEHVRAVAGFTLIEVLVVVAIIALLITILLPALSAARGQSRLVLCGTNLHTLGQAVVYYAQASSDEMPAGYQLDNNGKLLRDARGRTQIAINAFEFLYQYVHRLNPRKGQTLMSGTGYVLQVPTYACPDDRRQHATEERPMRMPDGQVWSVELSLSYGVNLCTLVNSLDADKFVAGTRKISSIKSPAQIVSFLDAGDDQRDGEQGWVLADCMADFSLPQCFFELRHRDGNQFLYMDSHVSFHKINRRPRQYGLPPFPAAWMPNWGPTSPRYADWNEKGHTAPIEKKDVAARCGAGC